MAVTHITSHYMCEGRLFGDSPPVREAAAFAALAALTNSDERPLCHPKRGMNALTVNPHSRGTAKS
jgi:hypothetical protein